MFESHRIIFADRNEFNAFNDRSKAFDIGYADMILVFDTEADCKEFEVVLKENKVSFSVDFY